MSRGSPTGSRALLVAPRRQLLRFPLTQVRVVAALWGAPIVVFTALNAPFSGRVAVYVAIAITLGGLVTCAISYLVAERLLRRSPRWRWRRRA